MLRDVLNTRKERLWPAILGAFAMHSMVISAVAFGVYGSRISQTNHENQLIAQIVYSVPSSSQHNESAPEKRSQKSSLEPQKKNKIESQDGCADFSCPVDDDIFYKKPLKRKLKKLNAECDSLSPKPNLAPSLPSAGTSPVYNPPPAYPREARRRKIEGVVMIQVFLSQTGTVTDVKSLPPHSHPLLEQAALTAIRQWRFTPGVRTLEVPIEFTLKE